MATTGARRRPQKYSDELRERAVRMVVEIRRDTGEKHGTILVQPANSARKAGLNVGLDQVARRFHLLLDVSGIVYVAFIVDVYSRRIVGLKAARTMRASLVVDALNTAALNTAALNTAAWTRRHTGLDGLIYHSAPGSQYTSIAYTDRLDEIGASPRSAPSVIRSITRWPSRSTRSSRPNCIATPQPSEPTVGRGAVLTTSRSERCFVAIRLPSTRKASI